MITPDYLKEPSLSGHIFGRLEYDEDKDVFVLTGEPLVLQYAKRIFPGARVTRGGGGRLEFHRTRREVSDLNWLLMRFPLNIEQCKPILDRARDDAVYQVNSRMSGSDKTRVKPPSEFIGKLHPYQEVGTNFLVTNKRCLLSDSMGLGKSWTSLAAAATAGEYPVLVICQTHVQSQWQRMIGMLFDMNGASVPDGTNPFRLAKMRGEKLAPILKSQTPYKIPDTPFAIIHYGLLQYWKKEILEKRFKTIIFDEVQELRHTGTAKYSSASELSESAENIFGLSVGGESNIELRGGCFGGGWVGPVEEAFDIVSELGVKDSDGVVSVYGMGIESRSLKGDRFGWSKVHKFYRHNCTSNTRGVFVGGDEIVLTDDHSVFKAEENGDVRCVRSDELSPGDIVPFDDGNDWDEPEEEEVDVIDIMKHNKRLQVVVDLSNVTRKQIGATPQEWQKYRKAKVVGERLPFWLYEKFKYMLPNPDAVYLAPSRAPRLCDTKVRMSDIAYLLGFFIGHGWIESGNRISFAVEKRFASLIIDEIKKIKFIHIEPKISDRKRGSVEIRVSSVILSALIIKSFGGKVGRSYEKRIPGEWIVSWPREARIELLRGMIDSDGSTSKRNGYINYSTTSKVLTKQLLSLLRSIGVRGSVYERGIADGGVVEGDVIHGRRKSFVVYWSGHAMRGDNSGHKGCRRKFKWTNGRFNEGRVRRSHNVDRPQFVYDLQMDCHPSFVANGALVHNSGTPIYGYGAEIWSVMNAIDFHCLGSYEAFTREWCTGYGEKIVSDPKALHGHLSREGLMLRRRASDEDVAISLPRVVRQVQDLNHDEVMYDSLIKTARENAEKYDSASFTAKGRIARLVESQSRQATGIAKADYVAQFVESLIEAGERPLLYGWHHAVYEAYLKRLGKYNPVIFTGKQTTKQKELNMERYSEGDTPLAILSLRSAAGLDGLQHHANICVFGELDWSPSIHAQSETRIARIGVDKTLDSVPSYYCVASVGHDEIMMDVLGVKTGQFVGIVGDEPESYEEQQEAEKRAAQRIQSLVEKLRNEKIGLPEKIKEDIIESDEIDDDLGNGDRCKLVRAFGGKLCDG